MSLHTQVYMCFFGKGLGRFSVDSLIEARLRPVDFHLEACERQA